LTRGDPDSAVTFYEQALAIARETGDRRREEPPWAVWGLHGVTLKISPEPLPFTSNNLSFFREIGDRGEKETL